MAGGFAEESKVLDISIDFNRVIQNLFLDVIDPLRPKDDEPEEVPVEESQYTIDLEQTKPQLCQVLRLFCAKWLKFSMICGKI